MKCSICGKKVFVPKQKTRPGNGSELNFGGKKMVVCDECSDNFVFASHPRLSMVASYVCANQQATQVEE